MGGMAATATRSLPPWAEAADEPRSQRSPRAAWVLGVALLGLGKILENMELGHNVMHGQYDWMNDPELRGTRYEWDIAGPSDFWRHTHNHIHHSYTNVLGKDDDVGGDQERAPDLMSGAIAAAIAR